MHKQYTIMDINRDRVEQDMNSSAIWKHERIEGRPLSSFHEKELDIMTHPHLFPDGKCGEKDPGRKIPVTQSNYGQLRLMSIDPRFRQSITYNFFLHNNRTLRDISSGIFSTVNAHKMNNNITAEAMLAKISKGDLDKEITNIFSRVRGTEEYLKIPRMNLETMIENYGSPSWFLTFSPNEWLWAELKVFLLTVDKNLSRQ